MGAWSEEAFGNDTALDWEVNFLDNPGLEMIRQTLDTALQPPEYLDADEACEAIAACEVLARLKGQWPAGASASDDQEIDQWVKQNPIAVPAELSDMAVRVIDRILGPDSELVELWAETEDDRWTKCVVDLRRRVAR